VYGFHQFIQAQLTDVVCWDGEIPRYTAAGTPINPGQSPPSWPVVKVFTPEPGFLRQDTFEDPYSDEGKVQIVCYGTTRQQLEGTVQNPGSGLWNRLEALFAQASLWGSVLVGGPSVNPYYVVQMVLVRWWCGQEEGVRTADSSLLYRAELEYETTVHGAVSSA
jgi:hypothetical protein